MALISICESGSTRRTAGTPVVVIGRNEHPFSFASPFDDFEEARLEWYFEQHLQFPFKDQIYATQAAASIEQYGLQLFEQIFAHRDAYRRYTELRDAGLEKLTIEIVGSPDFHSHHWEALRDPDLPQPLSLQATFVRRNEEPQTIEAKVQESPTINLLVVTARPHGARDVGYRTISPPLVTTLRRANVRVRIDILRPGSYEALVNHLEAAQERHSAGFYHIIHFDLHGAVASYAELAQIETVSRHAYKVKFADRYARGQDITPSTHQEKKAYLFFEGSELDELDPAEAGEVADLLINHRIPIAILNACQSAREERSPTDSGPGAAPVVVDDDRPATSETNLAARLMAAGVQMVLAMGYSVTVTAAEKMMARLYAELFDGAQLAAAIRSARMALYNDKKRRARFNRTIDLEDWLLPVVYENEPQELATRDFTPEERAAYYSRQAAAFVEPTVTYEFVGRDLDILRLEQRLLNRGNLALVRGMGGAGKTTLLRHLGWWWQTTHFVDQVFYYGYDERAWSRQQIMDGVARQLLGDIGYVTKFQPLPTDEAKQAFLAGQLRGSRHLLILDNLESITGTHLAIRNTLPEEERDRVHSFLQALAGGRTLVLLGSRSDEAWLAAGTFGDNVYDLPGLDPEAASALADLVLTRHDATRHRNDDHFARLLKLLDGYPLPIEVVLANLARQTPGQVIEALEAGEALEQADKDSDLMEAKTRSILRCIDYSHGNLAEADQELLLCLAPFTGIINLNWWEQYTDQLKQQEALVHLPFDRWNEVLQAAVDWGLLKPHPQVRDAVQPQPIFPYFLRNRLQEQPEMRAAIETAFRMHYDGLGSTLYQATTSREKEARQAGIVLTSVEYENLSTALNLSLQGSVSFFNAYEALFRFHYSQSDFTRALALSEQVLSTRDSYADHQLTDDVSREFYLTFERVAYSALETKKYSKAEAAYEEALDYVDELTNVSNEQRSKYKATIYHQLGSVAQEQRQWEQAEQYYQQALAIYIEFNDRFSQASTYHQLGRVAQEQRQWEQAEQYYQQALAIKIEFNDRFSQASTYHQLGSVAQEQRQWEQAEQYYQQVLAIYIDFNDQHNIGITVRNAARLWQAGKRASVVTMVAEYLKQDPDSVEKLFRQVDATEDASEPLGQTRGSGAVPPATESEDDGLDQPLRDVEQARRGDHELGGRLFGKYQQQAADPDASAEERSLARVLVRILVRDDQVDLSGLSEEAAAAVQALLARLRST